MLTRTTLTLGMNCDRMFETYDAMVMEMAVLILANAFLATPPMTLSDCIK